MRRLVKLLGFVVVAAMVYEEARKGPDEERWHGKALGFIPYDLRPPTLARFRDSYWDPADPRIFTGRVSGIGWAINFAAVADRVRRL